ncbi:hypothetical protein F5051DRAFT_341594 [Lentinula edodes]|nr:hypothetical protein F5051DRAFT_341594 [Lentinula edodes]
MLWLPDAFAYVNVDLGPEFTDLVSSWIALERSSEWKTNAQVRLPTSKRPTVLARWVDKKRYSTKGNEPLKEECGTDFSDNVKKWWVSMQPEWRITLSQKLTSPDTIPRQKQDWSRLDKFGINGWYGIVVCLKWWGRNLQYREAVDMARKDWLEILEDVCGMMKALTNYRIARVN